MMSAISGKDTKPELTVRRGLHAMGFRYRLHEKNLPGKPDLYFPKYRAVILVHGCFWHKHDCKYFKWPKTRPDFWREKINANVSRDLRNISQLNQSGLRTLVVWECSIRDRSEIEVSQLLEQVSLWLTEGKDSISM
jgi:DNA mismatch endonuclease (patch repair protein)